MNSLRALNANKYPFLHSHSIECWVVEIHVCKDLSVLNFKIRKRTSKAMIVLQVNQLTHFFQTDTHSSDQILSLYYFG